MRRLRWIAIAIAILAVGVVLAPLWAHPHGYGWHDWDQMEAHRYLADKTIRLYHQFPFWDPYECGGHTWWAGIESGTVIVPWLPIYLIFSLPIAIRIEVTIAVLVGVLGTWKLARRFTESAGACLLVTCVFLLNARFAMQLAVGHTWHLYYAGLPWALFFFDRAIFSDDARPVRDIVWLAVTMAMLVYQGAIYPLPQGALILLIYGVTLGISSRSLRPLAILGASGVLAMALAAPRLLPLVDSLHRFPRVVPSEETIDAGRFLAFYTLKATDAHPKVTPWGWHEFGIYIGWIPLALMLGSLFTFRTARERGLAYAGVFCILNAFGRFVSFAPWALLHDWVPVFRSQHVPTRWLFPAVLLLLVVAASATERWIEKRGWGARRPRFEIAALVICALVSFDVVYESHRALRGWFARPAPRPSESIAMYHQESAIPKELAYDEADWTLPALPAMRANVGLIQCGTFHGQAVGFRNEEAGLGAHGVGDADYRGETYFENGTAEASIESWSPNAVKVRFANAHAGDVLVLNQNWDPGWRAAHQDIIDSHDLVATRVAQDSGEIEFRYVPRFFYLGLVIFALACGAILVALRRRRL